MDGVTYDSSTEEIVRIDDVNVYTVEGVAAELPDTVEVVTNKNNTLEKKGTWDLEGVVLTNDSKVNGTVEGRQQSWQFWMQQ